jgi:hypothetical protein
MAAKSQDKIIFGVALVLLLASAGWMAMQGSKLSALRSITASGGTPAGYESATIDTTEVSTKTWPAPPAQTSGPLWVYDVFTPPEIFYNDITKKFTVTRPEGPVVDPIIEIPFGVTLVGVKLDAFRLQLVGYIGEEGDFRGNFENALSGETIIAREGKEIPDLGLKIKKFQVKRNRIESEGSMVTYEYEATAVVLDMKTGEEISLTNKHRYISGKPIASLKIDGSDQVADYKAGNTFTAGDATFKVLTVTDTPPSVEIVKTAPDLTEPVTKTLTPSVTIDAVPAPAGDGLAAPKATETPFPFGN